MNKIELKNILKPLIKHCVKEVLLEEGILSTVISEVIKGTQPALINTAHHNPPVLHNVADAPANDLYEQQARKQLIQQQRQDLLEEKERLLQEQKQKIFNATGLSRDIFEGVQPLAHGGSLDGTPHRGSLADVAPDDPGVDIAGIMALGGDKWKKLI